MLHIALGGDRATISRSEPRSSRGVDAAPRRELAGRKHADLCAGVDPQRQVAILAVEQGR